jgi:hypothetical protein
MDSSDQLEATLGIACLIVAYAAFLYAFWRRKKSRWVALILGFVGVFIMPMAAVTAVLVATAGQIDQSPLNSNKTMELLTCSVAGAVFVICLTLTDLRGIPLWVTVGITIALFAVDSLIVSLVMSVFLVPTRYREFIQKAKAEQNEVLAAQALRRENRRKIDS